jgi:DNA-binding SARP family transcriptional activator
LSATEQCIDLELKLGRHHDRVGELTELVARNPLRERLVGQLMLALHRCGRQAEALDAYRRLRTRLATELGIDPGRDLQELHGTILRNEAGAPPPPSTSDTVVVPRQLPAPARHFVGRNDELKDLTRLVDTAAAGGAARW